MPGWCCRMKASNLLLPLRMSMGVVDSQICCGLIRGFIVALAVIQWGYSCRSGQWWVLWALCCGCYREWEFVVLYLSGLMSWMWWNRWFAHGLVLAVHWQGWMLSCCWRRCCRCVRVVGQFGIVFLCVHVSSCVRDSGWCRCLWQCWQEKAKPVADKLYAWLQQKRLGTTKNADITKAIEYCLKRWTALTRYLDDGSLPIDNNWAENQMRPWALGRKNWLSQGRLRAVSGRLVLCRLSSQLDWMVLTRMRIWQMC